MHTARNILLAGIAAVAIAGSAGLALAQSGAFHHMTVTLPDGSTAQIAYSGDVAPRVSFDQNPFAQNPAAQDLLAAAYAPDWQPFAEMDRISAEMDREMDALMNWTAAPVVPLVPIVPMYQVDLRNMAPGAAQYAFVSQIGNGTACAQTMSVTRDASGHRKVVSHSYGNCGALNGRASLSREPDRFTRRPAQGTIQAKAPVEPRSHAPSLVETAYHPGD